MSCIRSKNSGLYIYHVNAISCPLYKLKAKLAILMKLHPFVMHNYRDDDMSRTSIRTLSCVILELFLFGLLELEQKT